MTANGLDLASAKKLKALRETDIFHPWNSLDEYRCCGRCGQIFTGHEIKVYRQRRRRGETRYRLECPTEGCPSVPIEWMVIQEPAIEATNPFSWFTGG